MDTDRKDINVCDPRFFDISDDDIIEAMKEISGYIDITTGDFKILYRSAYEQAVRRLTRSVKARDIMTENVIYVMPDTPSEEIAGLMASHGIAGVPVVDQGRSVVGVISEKDFLVQMGGEETRSFMDVIARCLMNRGCTAITMRRQKARDIMTSPAITAHEDTPVAKIADLFNSKKINRVPVTDDLGRLIGIVARADILKYPFPLMESDRNDL